MEDMAQVQPHCGEWKNPLPHTHFFLSLNGILLDIIPSSIRHWHLGCLHSLAILENASMNMGAHISPCSAAFTFLRDVPSRGMAAGVNLEHMQVK